MAKKIILVGLMNPGEKYRFTRHNAGAMALDAVYPDADYKLVKPLEAFSADYGSGENSLILIKPQTFMNLSGQSVGKTLKKHAVAASHLIVLHDEVELAVGEVRHKFGGGHKGHNGLRSIMAVLGNGDFHRIRIGVGRPVNDENGIADYLLSFQPESQRARKEKIMEALAVAMGAINNA